MDSNPHTTSFLFTFSIFDPASRLSFDLIEKNFIGKELTTTKCVCCETTSDRTDDVMYFYIPLSEQKEFGKNFIRVSNFEWLKQKANW